MRVNRTGEGGLLGAIQSCCHQRVARIESDVTGGDAAKILSGPRLNFVADGEETKRRAVGGSTEEVLAESRPRTSAHRQTTSRARHLFSERDSSA